MQWPPLSVVRPSTAHAVDKARTFLPLSSKKQCDRCAEGTLMETNGTQWTEQAQGRTALKNGMQTFVCAATRKWKAARYKRLRRRLRKCPRPFPPPF